jgi:tetratricopeptide (TPR) repeat protein
MRHTFLACACLALCLTPAEVDCADTPKVPGPEETSAPAESAGDRDLLGLAGRTEWLGLLTAACESADAPTRARAAFLIGQVCAGAREHSTPRCENTLHALAQDPDRDVRIHAGIASGHLGVGAAIPTCVAGVVDGPRWRRYYAVVALARIGTPRARRLLLRGVEGQSEYIRQVAEYFLLAPADRPNNQARKKEYTAVAAGPPPPEGTAPEEIFAAAADQLWTVTDYYWHSGQHEDCIRLGLTATFLDATHLDAWGGAAWLTWSAGRDAEAIGIYQDGLDANPSQYDMYFELGFHLYNLHRYRAALPYLRKATELASPPTTRRMYAHCLEKAGQLGQSLQVWTALLKQYPDDHVVVQNHARVKRRVEAGE